MALDEITPEERRRAATLDAELKPFYKRRSFWLLLLLGMVLGAGIAVAIPLVGFALATVATSTLVTGFVGALFLATGPIGGWAIIAITGAVVGLALMAATYALVRGISNKMMQSRKAQQTQVPAEEPEIVTRHVEGSEAANEIAARIATLMTEDKPGSRQEEIELRQTALNMHCANAAQKAAFYYAALGVTCAVGGNKEFSENDYSSAYRKLALRWHPDRNRTVANAEAEFKSISEIVEQLKNPESDLWKYVGVSVADAAAFEELEKQAGLYKQERAEREREREAQNRDIAELRKGNREGLKTLAESQQRQGAQLKEHGDMLKSMGEELAEQAAELGSIRETMQETRAEGREIATQVQDMFATLSKLQQPKAEQLSSTSATTSKVIRSGPVIGNADKNAVAPVILPSALPVTTVDEIIVEEVEQQRRSSITFGSSKKYTGE